jgi:hypothetical protein
METLVENKTKKIEEHNLTSVMYDAVIEVEKDINHFVEFNEYSFDKPLNIPRELLKKQLDKSSLNERRKLKRAINNFYKRNSLRSANLMLHTLFKHILKVDNRVTIKYPQKYLDILKKREIFVKKRLEMEQALTAYKEERGSYFKLRLANGQKIG